MSARVDDPDLDVTADSVLVLRNAGPLGGPGMPEWGMLPIPKKLLKARRPRHGPDLRRTDVRHRLRHLRPPRRPRVLRRRPTRARPDRRHDHARRPWTAAST